MKQVLSKSTQSSLLIPKRLLNDFDEKTKDISREVFFHSLLLKYKALLLDGLLQKSMTSKTSYQDEGQNLVKRNFRPADDDWIELGILANFLGISRTALFTWFLILELSDFDEILRERFYAQGVPPKIDTLLLKSYLARGKITHFWRQIYYKEFAGLPSTPSFGSITPTTFM